jgi:hypothetical protein
MLPAGNLVAVEPQPGYRPETSWVHYTTSCKHSLTAPEDRRIYRPKRVELIGINNKPTLLHLVRCLYYLHNNLCSSSDHVLYNIVASHSSLN